MKGNGSKRLGTSKVTRECKGIEPCKGRRFSPSQIKSTEHYYAEPSCLPLVEENNLPTLLSSLKINLRAIGNTA